MLKYANVLGGKRKDIYDLIRDRGELTTKTITDEIGIAMQGINRHLQILQKDGYVIRGKLVANKGYTWRTSNIHIDV